MALEQPDELRHLALAAHERRGRDGERGGVATVRLDLERRIVSEDLLLQRTQGAPRLEPELVEFPVRERVVRESVRLPAAAVERQHRELLRRLAQRARLRVRDELGHDRVVTAQRELRPEPLLRRREAQVLEALRLVAAARRRRGPRTPGRARARAHGPRATRRGRGFLGATGLDRLREELLEPRAVDLAGLDGERVAPALVSIPSGFGRPFRSCET